MPNRNKLYQPDMTGNPDWIPRISGFLECQSKNIRFYWNQTPKISGFLYYYLDSFFEDSLAGRKWVFILKRDIEAKTLI